MDHTNLILIISILTFSSAVGFYVIIKKINQHIPAPENVLVRRGDIELANFNEPTHPLQAYFQTPDSENFSNYPQSNNDLGSIQNIRVGNVNSHYPELIFNNYNEFEKYYINSILENENIFNTEIIPIIILFFIIIIFIKNLIL